MLCLIQVIIKKERKLILTDNFTIQQTFQKNKERQGKKDEQLLQE